MDIQTDKRLTVEEAAHSLKLSTKTVQRYLASGLLTRIKVNHRTYLLHSEIVALADLKGQGQDTDFTEKTAKTSLRDIVTLNRDRYERLLIELGELRKERDYLLVAEKACRELETKLRAREEEIRELRKAHGRSETMRAERTNTSGTTGSLRPAQDEDVGPIPQKPWWTR
jgi:hypothetical protein